MKQLQLVKNLQHKYWNIIGKLSRKMTSMAMADYTEESMLITPDKTFTGLKEIRENFIYAFLFSPKTQPLCNWTNQLYSRM